MTEAIDYFSLSHPLRGLASRVSFRARRQMFKLFMEVMRPGPEQWVLDVGVTPDQSLPESNFFEQLYPHKSRLVAAGIEDASFLQHKYPGLRVVRCSGLQLPFADKAFDIVFCAAVLEHVGARENQKALVHELLRVAQRFFITTPNRQFPLEFHTFLPFLHWCPQPVHQAMLRRLGLDFWAQTENLNLLSPHSLRELFPPAREWRLCKSRLLGMPSNLIAYGAS